mmetsp:Transcript_35813/g.91484  ORF Transcript_35813/g.91484 Transcript_35813/m.91484 type:complete len:140 (+) Transcript_35813:1314-1733(+)
MLELKRTVQMKVPYYEIHSAWVSFTTMSQKCACHSCSLSFMQSAFMMPVGLSRRWKPDKLRHSLPIVVAASSRGQDIIRQLHALYTCSDPPPTEPLRHPRCFESLLAALFNPDHNLPHKTATVYMHILVCHSRIAVITG